MSRYILQDRRGLDRDHRSCQHLPDLVLGRSIMNDEIRIPEPVIEACRQLYELRLAIAADADVRRARRRVQDTHRLYQDATNELERLETSYQPKIQEIENYLTPHALEIGQTFESSGVKVKFVKGHVRRSMSSKMIDEIELNQSDLWDQLKTLIKISEIKPRVTVISD